MTGKVLVVGASGFVGQSVVRYLLNRGERISAASRRPFDLPSGASWVQLPDLTLSNNNWTPILEEVDSIVYLAARVHVMNDRHDSPLTAYKAVNCEAAVSLAQAAARCGVRRFIYISSVKVNGESSQKPLTEVDEVNPKDPYGISKLDAEQELLALGRNTNLEVVILRPPLIYGPGVKANFMALAKLSGRGIPLPIGAIHNQRSMIYVENLADLIAVVLKHPAASGEVFFASDGQDLSTPELARRLAEAQGRNPWLPAVPVVLLQIFGLISKRSDVIQRLTGSLQVSSEKASKKLDWVPPYPTWQALARTGQSLVQKKGLKISEKTDFYKINANQANYIFLRSIFERFLAAILLILLSPLYIIITTLIMIDSRGPVIFTQARAGKSHRPFTIYKFRTMRYDAPQLSTEEMQKSGLNAITRIGFILRRTSLDEIPQLINILRGEMSFIGPRPALLTQSLVLRLRKNSGVIQLSPGITGYAQATGRDDLDDQDKVGRDEYYLKNIGIYLDMKIIFMTLQSILTGRGNK